MMGVTNTNEKKLLNVALGNCQEIVFCFELFVLLSKFTLAFAVFHLLFLLTHILSYPFISFHDHHTERASKEHINWKGDNNTLQNTKPYSLAKGVPRSAMYLAARLRYRSNLPTSFRTTVHNRFPIPPGLIIDRFRPHRSHHLLSLLS
jgi:hypothetical protein